MRANPTPGTNQYGRATAGQSTTPPADYYSASNLDSDDGGQNSLETRLATVEAAATSLASTEGMFLEAYGTVTQTSEQSSNQSTMGYFSKSVYLADDLVPSWISYTDDTFTFTEPGTYTLVTALTIKRTLAGAISVTLTLPEETDDYFTQSTVYFGNFNAPANTTIWNYPSMTIRVLDPEDALLEDWSLRSNSPGGQFIIRSGKPYSITLTTQTFANAVCELSAFGLTIFKEK